MIYTIKWIFVFIKFSAKKLREHSLDHSDPPPPGGFFDGFSDSLKRGWTPRSLIRLFSCEKFTTKCPFWQKKNLCTRKEFIPIKKQILKGVYRILRRKCRITESYCNLNFCQEIWIIGTCRDFIPMSHGDFLKGNIVIRMSGFTTKSHRKMRKFYIFTMGKKIEFA